MYCLVDYIAVMTMNHFDSISILCYPIAVPTLLIVFEPIG